MTRLATGGATALGTRNVRRAVKVLLAVVVVAAVLFLFGFPVRTLLQQRHQTSVAETRSRELAAENAKLTQRAAQLQTSAEIEQIARQEYGLVLPGQSAYAILPPEAAATTTTTTAPGLPSRQYPR